MENLRLSMVCMNSKLGDTRSNRDRILGFMAKASEAGSDIVCFPELALTGYAMPESSSSTVSTDSEEFRSIVESTASDGMCVCFGFAEEGGYISQAVAEDGKLVGIYRKTHLGHREEKCMVPGGSLPVFRTRKAVIGLQVCWESHFPEITVTYALKGADLVLMPHASGLAGIRRMQVWNKMLPARAYDNTLYVAACNQVGDNGFGTVFGGGSCILNARGEILAEDYSGECMLSADLDAGALENLRKPGYDRMSELYFLEKRRPELYFR